MRRVPLVTLLSCVLMDLLDMVVRKTNYSGRSVRQTRRALPVAMFPYVEEECKE